MKIGIISDTHDRMEAIKWFVDEFKKQGVKIVLHAGDIISPFAAKPFADFNFTAVFGNNCGEKLFLRDTIEEFGGKIKQGPIELEINGKKFALMHEPYALNPFAKSGLFDYVIYGHTHEVVKRKEGNTMVLNPGEACGYLTGKATALVLDTERGTVLLLQFY